MTDTPTCYDKIPYPWTPYSQSHPDRLATVAALLGMRPAAIERCRVLELGCAGGGNLVPMAVALPASEFLGIDISARQIAQGQTIISRLGLTNVQIRQQDILDFDQDDGEFDYIIAHGLFSWVRSELRERIFAICQQLLAPQGIAYISYNIYPGWHMRGMLLDGTRDRDQLIEELADQIADGSLVLPQSEQLPKNAQRLRSIVADQIEPCLNRIAKAALLVA